VAGCDDCASRNASVPGRVAPKPKAKHPIRGGSGNAYYSRSVFRWRQPSLPPAPHSGPTFPFLATPSRPDPLLGVARDCTCKGFLFVLLDPMLTYEPPIYRELPAKSAPLPLLPRPANPMSLYVSMLKP